MKRTPLSLILVVSLAACTSTSEPAPVGSVAAASAIPAVPTATPSATTPPLVPSGAAPAPAPTFDPMAGIGTGPKDVTEVVPGVSIGPLKLGMTRAELKTLGYEAKPVPPESYRDVINVIPYSIHLRDDRVVEIEVTLPLLRKGLRIRGNVLSPQSTLTQLGAWFAGCEPFQRRLGGDSFRCEGKRLRINSGGGSHQISVRISAEPALDFWEQGLH